MKRLFLTYIFALLGLTIMAVPAQRGQWKTITLADGSKVKVEAAGDEYCSFWRSASGAVYQKENNVYVRKDAHLLEALSATERGKVAQMRSERFQKYFGNTTSIIPNKKKTVGDFQKLAGVKKGSVILVEFDDIHFTAEHTPEFYKKVLNECGPAEKGYVGGVKQYFLDQSNGKFTVDFDVTPIIRMPSTHDAYTNDVPAMIRYATKLLPSSIDWTQYDWDNDGDVEVVYVLYAGYGQAQKTDDKTLIWPKQAYIGNNNPVLDGKRLFAYACSNEINWNGGEGDVDNGIGTFCHEFSHCLGYADLYDICGQCEKNEVPGMGYWDIMDGGCYNGNGFIPMTYSSFEKMTAGWITPTPLENNKSYTNVRAICEQDGGDLYYMQNPNNANEYYFFQVIKNAGWTAGLYKAKGLLVYYVNYDSKAWRNNLVNCMSNVSINNMARYTFIPADGSYILQTTTDLKGDLYPSSKKNAVSLMWNEPNSQGNYYCDIMLSNITVNADSTVSFVTKPYQERVLPEGALFYESFDMCTATGGNDNIWEDNTTTNLYADNAWQISGAKGANQCAMIGTATQAGYVISTALFLAPGTYKLSFKAGRYGNEVPKLYLEEIDGATTFAPAEFALNAGEWTNCETVFTANDKPVAIKFRASTKGRWFLDEVLITKYEATSIKSAQTSDRIQQNTTVYNTAGQKVKADYKGIIIKNGKKVVR